jgi:outer membrane protein assembly factor BamA
VGDNAREWRDGMKASAGAGLLVPTPLGRFELNLAQPIGLPGSTEPLSRLQRFQIGLGYRFL